MAKLTFKLTDHVTVQPNNSLLSPFQDIHDYVLEKQTLAVIDVKDDFRSHPLQGSITFPAETGKGIQYAKQTSVSYLASVTDDKSGVDTGYKFDYEALVEKNVSYAELAEQNPNIFSRAAILDTTVNLEAYGIYLQTSLRPMTFHAHISSITYQDNNNEKGLRPKSDLITVSDTNGTTRSGYVPFDVSVSGNEKTAPRALVDANGDPHYNYSISAENGKNPGQYTITGYHGESITNGSENENVYITANIKSDFTAWIQWNDFMNKAGTRPASLPVKLYRGKQLIDTATATGTPKGEMWTITFPAVQESNSDNIYIHIDDAGSYKITQNDNRVVILKYNPHKHFKITVDGDGDYGTFTYALEKSWTDPNTGENHNEIIATDDFQAEGGNDIDLGDLDTAGTTESGDSYDQTYNLVVTQLDSKQAIDLKEADDGQNVVWSFTTIKTPVLNQGTAYKGVFPTIGTAIGIVGITKKPIWTQLQQIDFVTGEVALQTNNTISLMK